MDEVSVGVVIAIAAVLVGVAWAGSVRGEFEGRFPPISDAEFLARCSPAVNPAVALRVRRLVAEHFAVEYERVHPSMSFVEDLGAD